MEIDRLIDEFAELYLNVSNVETLGLISKILSGLMAIKEGV